MANRTDSTKKESLDVRVLSKEEIDLLRKDKENASAKLKQLINSKKINFCLTNEKNDDTIFMMINLTTFMPSRK